MEVLRTMPGLYKKHTARLNPSPEYAHTLPSINLITASGNPIEDKIIAKYVYSSQLNLTQSFKICITLFYGELIRRPRDQTVPD